MPASPAPTVSRQCGRLLSSPGRRGIGTIQIVEVERKKEMHRMDLMSIGNHNEFHCCAEVPRRKSRPTAARNVAGNVEVQEIVVMWYR
jgi:hypothetical protein